MPIPFLLKNLLRNRYDLNVSLAKKKLTHLYQYSERGTSLVSDMFVGAD